MKKNPFLLLLLVVPTPVLLAQVRPEQLVRAAQEPHAIAVGNAMVVFALPE